MRGQIVEEFFIEKCVGILRAVDQNILGEMDNINISLFRDKNMMLKKKGRLNFADSMSPIRFLNS